MYSKNSLEALSESPFVRSAVTDRSPPWRFGTRTFSYLSRMKMMTLGIGHSVWWWTNGRKNAEYSALRFLRRNSGFRAHGTLIPCFAASRVLST